MRKRRIPIKGFNAVDGSGYAIRFEQYRGKWSAVTSAAEGMIVVGRGSTLGKCRQSISDGIRFSLEGMREDGMKIPEPEGRTVPFMY